MKTYSLAEIILDGSDSMIFLRPIIKVVLAKEFFYCCFFVFLFVFGNDFFFGCESGMRFFIDLKVFEVSGGLFIHEVEWFRCAFTFDKFGYCAPEKFFPFLRIFYVTG